MFRKRLADKIKASLAWSVISEEGERIPANSHAEDGGSNDEANSKSNNENQSPFPVGVVSQGVEKILENSERKFQPEFLLKKSEKKESVPQEPPVKRPTAAFRAAWNKDSGPGKVSAITVPSELVQSSELLAESAISMSLSVLSAEKEGNAPAKKGDSAPDRERSIEFKSYASKEWNRTG